jgi:pimeloyl-ACP methyl ester carboxylesterase
MPFVEANQKKGYYEVHGDHPNVLVLLNGIMMSSASWQPFVEMLKKHVTVVLVDFFDQGKSDYMDCEYTQETQVELVQSLLEKLDLKHVTLLGISYGGEIAMKVARRHQGRIDRLILANTTAYTNPQLRAIGDAWINAAKTYDGRQFFKATIPPIYSNHFYESRLDWLGAREDLFVKLFDKHWYDGFIRLVISAENHDDRTKLSLIKVPTLIIGSDEDMITPIGCQKALLNEIDHAKMVIIAGCGHASMYEKPVEFFAAVLGFIFVSEETFTI